jgi:glutamate dehydrogenase
MHYGARDVSDTALSVADATLSLLAQEPDAGQRDALEALARGLLRRAPHALVDRVPPERLVGSIRELLAFVDARRDPVAVRVGEGPDGSTVLYANTADSPFLVDTVRGAIAAEGLTVRTLLHPVFGIERAADGSILQIGSARGAPARESVMRIELVERPDAERADALAAEVARSLEELRAAVADHAEMASFVGRMIDVARGAGARSSEEEIDETVAFLEWLREQHFVYLGSRDYAIVDSADGPALRLVAGTGRGILRDETHSTYAEGLPLAQMTPGLRERIEGGDLLLISKTNRQSRVHRRARMDSIDLKRIDEHGAVVGELRLIGLFTSLVYMEQAARTPLLRRKLRRIVAAEDLIEGSHDYKATVAVFESFPRDELFQAGWAELREQVTAVLEADEAHIVSVAQRPDATGKGVAVLVAMPRDRFSSDVRRRLQDLLLARFGGDSVDYHLSLGDGDAAHLFFSVHNQHAPLQVVASETLESAVRAACRTWDDDLGERLLAEHGAARGVELAAYYSRRFPAYYKTATHPELARLHVRLLERVRGGAPFAAGLQNEDAHHTHEGADPLTRIVVAKLGGKMPLSSLLPVLEDLGLTVVEEVPTRLEGLPDDDAFLHDFGVLLDGAQLQLDALAPVIEEAILAILTGEAESDLLNGLIARAAVPWGDVQILRSYRRYRQMVRREFTETYQSQVLIDHAETAALILDLFHARFGPSESSEPDREAALAEAISARIDDVPSLDEDRILRGFLQLVLATVRTNAYRDDRGRRLSLKLRSADVPSMPAPAPLFEVFVSDPEMEGIHLRGGRVARGGIRWSDRREDYRTEVLGLMKAQTVKNAVIVPVGSKGGFVLKRPPSGRDELRDDVRRQYSTLIRGLLDVTDTIVSGAVVHPPGVRVHDDDDPYLVVAADKGTAALSDTANAIAAEYGFWLGDAFASGGSTGYDHKALGITARGAWESVRRHFRELGHDVERKPFTVVGIGDMSGDVFGNGMLRSQQIRLVAAFDHRNVFLDPNPDPAVSFAERRRLFELGAAGSWADYDPGLISAGGGVFSRSAKSIPLTPEVRAALGVTAVSMTPAEVCQAILRAPVDLLWNGGIGTFVKAAEESHEEVGDRANDAIRIDGRELRTRVVAEGGNLGVTQRGRIEYALAGGRSNTDAIDNSAGVDCSDHEVNLKILLDMAVERGQLAAEARNPLLAELADDVCAQVLYDNYLQVQILSQEEAVAHERLESHEALMEALEQDGALDRALEFLPAPEVVAERGRAGRGLTRPELSVLMGYAKLALRERVLRSSVPDDPFLERELRAYFPHRVLAATGELYREHPLRREIAATIATNEVINDLGSSWVWRCVAETGAEHADVVRAFYVARAVCHAKERWDAVEALFADPRVDTETQMELMRSVDWLVESLARWYLRERDLDDLTGLIERDEPAFVELAAGLRQLGTPEWRAERALRREAYIARGVSPEVAEATAWHPELSYAPDVIAAVRSSGRTLFEAATAYFTLGERLHLDWLEQALGQVDPASRWQRWAQASLDDDLRVLRREVTERLLLAAPGEPVEQAVEQFLAERANAVARLERVVESIRSEGMADLAPSIVAVRQARAALA